MAVDPSGYFDPDNQPRRKSAFKAFTGMTIDGEIINETPSDEELKLVTKKD